jgi:ATP-binding cassette subfamily B protein
MDRPVLEGFDLEIPGGYTTAIVGTNGAGKSTLIKLLCRFYDPQGGRITLDGVDLRALAIEDLRRQMTVLFQTPVQFCATAAENIAFGDVGAGSEEAAIRAAAAAAGVDALVRDLPQGYATPLGVLFDQGVDLSVGQWQRLALARAYHRPAPLLILDEPTSALDPWAEADWLARFRTLSAGRTALVITHRFSTARHADFIHVMDGGRIVESGTHAELRAAGGPYAVLWHGQLAGRRDGRDGAATRRA